MSAFLVQDKLINRVVTMLSGPDFQAERAKLLELTHSDVATHEGMSDIGLRMHVLNRQALDVEYSTASAIFMEDRDIYQFVAQSASPVQTFKSLECWLYQCTQGDIDETPLYTLMEQISLSMSHWIVKASSEYKAAKWSD